MAANWRSIGPTTLAAFEAEIRARAPRSPLLAEVEAIYEWAKPHSRLLLGMCWAENQFMTDPSDKFPDWYHNFMHMKTPDGAGWAAFPTFASAAIGWISRITSDTYKNGIYAKTTTLPELIHVYAPSSDNNDEAAYVRTVETIVAELIVLERELGGAPPSDGGTTVGLALTGLGVGALLGPGKPNYPGGLLTGGDLFIAVHENGNPEADCDHEYGFVLGGGGEHRVSPHFAVSWPTAAGHTTRQMVPANRIGWHAGDGCDSPADYGCFASVAIEHSQSRNPDKWLATKRAGRELMAALILGDPRIVGVRTGAFSADRIVPHKALSGKYCPEYQLNEGSLPSQIAGVRELVKAEGQPAPTPRTVKPVPVAGKDKDGESIVIQGNEYVWVGKIFTTKRDTIRYQWAYTESPRSKTPIKKGTRFTIKRIMAGTGHDGKPELWGETVSGWRVLLADLF